MRARALRRVPDLQEEARQPGAQPLEARLEQGGDGRRGIERKLHRRPEDALLRLEVMKDELRVDAGGRGDAADGRALEPVPAELGAGGGEDLLACAARAWPSTGSRHEAPGSAPPHSRRPASAASPAGPGPSGSARREATG